MGRTAIGKFTAVRLSEEMLERIDALTVPGGRAGFIRDAVARALDQAEAAERNAGLADPVALYRMLAADKGKRG